METIILHEHNNGMTFFSLMVDDHEVGRMMINIHSGILRAGHTGIDLSRQHKGYGKKLVDRMAEYARENGLKVIPDCGFVNMMFSKHPELYGDILGVR